MLILANIGKAELELTTSATNEILCRQSKGWRKFIVDYLQNASERVNNMVRRMALRYISMELYHQIVNEVEKIPPKFASRIQK